VTGPRFRVGIARIGWLEHPAVFDTERPGFAAPFASRDRAELAAADWTLFPHRAAYATWAAAVDVDAERAEAARRRSVRRGWYRVVAVWAVAAAVIGLVIWGRYALADGDGRCAWRADPALCAQVQDGDR
jgi:hypothetical protein